MSDHSLVPAQERPTQKSLLKMIKTATEQSVVYEDERVKITVGPGFIEQEGKRKIHKNFTIFTDYEGSYKKEIEEKRAVRDAFEDQLHFKMRGAMPIEDDDFSPFLYSGYEFENKVTLRDILPDGWYKDKDRPCIYDDKNRARGLYYDHVERNVAFLRLTPRFSFENNLVASQYNHKLLSHSEEDGRLHQVFAIESKPCFMPSIMMNGEPALPFFIYANYAMWSGGPDPEFDFTRVNRELKAVKKAQQFIAGVIAEHMPGITLRTGTHEVILRAPGEGALAIGQDVPGDVFAYWDDEEDVRKSLDTIRDEVAPKLPEILGKDNSIILKLFPTADDITHIKSHPPDYTPPEPKRWQRVLYRIDRLLTRRPKDDDDLQLPSPE